ncbi:hypothetical protein R1flu_024878 [Riccia fluitans]|uniref:Fungal lipase-type domain-containing protein n=1 Tax=Riccia fluitans TaxID=41844 RepID=A0ABD1XZ54_9MARC
MDFRESLGVDHYHHQGTASPTLTNHFLESLFFSMSVYEPTEEALLRDLESRFGRVQPLMSYGFGSNGGGGQQAIFVARSHSGRVIVACRGTSGFRDVLQDLKYIQSRLSFARGTAHWGFAERAESVPIDFFLKLLDAGEELIFTGHSMGGAVASLLTLRVLESELNRKGMFEEQVRCITFGTPLFASSRLAEMINEKYEDIFIHIVSRRDVVPKILPWVSTLQKLVYAAEDHLEGLVVLKSVLGFVPWVPFAKILTFLERRIPSVLKFLFRCVMKLALPSGMFGSYAFAGHIVMLDTMAAAAVKVGEKENDSSNDSLILTSAEELNAWHSQLSFAFGSGFDVAMIEEHMLDCYHDGIVRAFSQVRLTRELNPSGELDPSFTTTTARDGKIIVRMVQNDERDIRGCCEVEVKSALLSDGVTSDTTTKTTFVRANSLASISRTFSAGERSLMCGHQNNQKRRLERSLTMGMRSSSCSHEGSVWSLNQKHQRQIQLGGKKERRCRACQCLRMYMNVKGSCRQVTKSFFHLGWILGTVGRVARHLKILDNLCAFTFFRLILGNILG